MSVRIESFGGLAIHDVGEEPFVPPAPSDATEAEIAAGGTQAGTSVSSDGSLTPVMPSTGTQTPVAEESNVGLWVGLGLAVFVTILVVSPDIGLNGE
jgi:hypothetical protein